MRKSEKKAAPIRFHKGLQQLRKDAGGMDIGASEIWVDVGLDNDSEPVRRLETFTADLNRMAEWLIGCGIQNSGHGIHRCVLPASVLGAVPDAVRAGLISPHSQFPL